jgi:hypothetical protein
MIAATIGSLQQLGTASIVEATFASQRVRRADLPVSAVRAGRVAGPQRSPNPRRRSTGFNPPAMPRIDQRFLGAIFFMASALPMFFFREQSRNALIEVRAGCCHQQQADTEELPCRSAPSDHKVSPLGSRRNKPFTAMLAGMAIRPTTLHTMFSRKPSIAKQVKQVSHEPFAFLSAVPVIAVSPVVTVTLLRLGLSLITSPVIVTVVIVVIVGLAFVRLRLHRRDDLFEFAPVEPNAAALCAVVELHVITFRVLHFDFANRALH